MVGMQSAGISEDTHGAHERHGQATGQRQGFGFIAADRGVEYFFHRSACKGATFDQLREGHAVGFDVGEVRKGRVQRT
jgi:cold shock CspA family protein